MDKKCVACERVLPLDKFSKNARKGGDKAVCDYSASEDPSDMPQKCINCTQNWEDLEADPHNAVKEQKIYDHLEETGVGKPGAASWRSF